LRIVRFLENTEMIHRRFSYWLRSVRSAANFARVYNGGYANGTSASASNGVRPLFFVNYPRGGHDIFYQ